MAERSGFVIRSRCSVRPLRPAIVSLVSVALVAPAVVTAHATTVRPRTVLTHQGVVTRQDIPSRGKSEPDTVVEPDVAVDPKNRNVAIAAAHDSRFADGGAVDISVAWTRDGGASWHHHAVRGITIAAGGTWA